MAKVWAALVASVCVVGVGLVFGLGQPGSTPPAPTRPSADPAPAVVEALKDPLPGGAVARLGTTWFRHDEWVHDAAWSPDGKAIASAAGPTVIIWDAASGREAGRMTLTEEQFPGPADPDFSLPKSVGGLEWLSDGNGLRTRFNGATQEWAWDGKVLKLARSAPTRPDEAATPELGFVPSKLVYDGTRKILAACGPNDDESPKHIEVWDAKPMKRRFRVAFPGETPTDVRAFALSPDGKWLVTGGGDKVLRWWDTTTGKVARTAGPGQIYFNRAAFRPDGKVLLTVSHENHIRLWDVETGKEMPHPVGLPWGVSGLALTPDAKTALIISERNLCAFDLASGRELWRRFGDVDAMGRVVVTPDGRTAITSSSGGKVTFWNVSTGAKTRQIDNQRESATHLAVSPDGHTLAAIGSGRPHDGEIRRWEVESGKPLPTLKLPQRDVLYSNYGLRFAPDGLGLAVASGTDLFVPVVNGSNSEVRNQYGKTDGGINWIEYSPDGWTVAATSGNSLYLWETATGKDRLKCSNIGYITCFAFSPDGRYLAVGNHGTTTRSSGGKRTRMDADKSAVRILDAFTGKEVHRFSGHTGGLRKLAWTRDGRRLITASDDSTCLVWDTGVFSAAEPVEPLEAAAAEKLWGDLSSLNVGSAYQAIGRLMLAPAPALDQARKHLTPVRAVEAVAVTRLMGQLDNCASPSARRPRPAGEPRRRATGQLRQALKGSVSAEAQADREGPGRLGRQRWPARDGTGLEVLERIGTAEAKSYSPSWLAERTGVAHGTGQGQFGAGSGGRNRGELFDSPEPAEKGRVDSGPGPSRPGDESTPAWDPAPVRWFSTRQRQLNAVSARPSPPFQLIVNRDTGPGSFSRTIGIGSCTSTRADRDIVGATLSPGDGAGSAPRTCSRPARRLSSATRFQSVE